jgi:hypothetical protein
LDLEKKSQSTCSAKSRKTKNTLWDKSSHTESWAAAVWIGETEDISREFLYTPVSYKLESCEPRQTATPLWEFNQPAVVFGAYKTVDKKLSQYQVYTLRMLK